MSSISVWHGCRLMVDSPTQSLTDSFPWYFSPMSTLEGRTSRLSYAAAFGLISALCVDMIFSDLLLEGFFYPYFYGKLTDTSARPEVRGTADVGWRSLNPLPINLPRTHSRLYHHMCLRTDGR